MGVSISAVKEVAASTGRCGSFRDEDGRALVDLPDAPLPDPDTPAPARFLPVWDATLLVHARRTQILPEEFRPRVFNTKTPHSVNTFLLDGQVAGTWRYDKGALSLEPFRTADPCRARSDRRRGAGPGSMGRRDESAAARSDAGGAA